VISAVFLVVRLVRGSRGRKLLGWARKAARSPEGRKLIAHAREAAHDPRNRKRLQEMLAQRRTRR
jgi:hypothetical protein